MSLNFVAAEDGLENDPKVLTLARLLKKPRAFAFWCVMRWRRLVVNTGNPLTGAIPKSYTANDVAAFLDWEGKPSGLIAAMKATGFLASKKGRGLFYPAWPETVTGHYASRREVDRRRDEARRAERREAELRGSSVEAPGGSEINKGREPAEGPPGPPLEGGDLGWERWRWLEQNAPTPRNDGVCRPILAAMSAAEWDLVQIAFRRYQALKAGVGTPICRKDRCLESPTDIFLKKKDYQRYTPKKRPAIKEETAGKVTVTPLEKAEKQRLERDRYLREMFLDPEVPQEKKDAERSAWLSDPENADRVPPWKNPAPANGHAKHPERPS